jgi:molecular chaperone DnaK
MGKVIGIDLGTTNSVAAFVEAKNPEIILTSEGDRLLPSVVAFTQSDERLIGSPAKSQLITNPLNTISSVKRLMGKRFSEVQPYLWQFPYKLIEAEDDILKIVVNDMEFFPEEISAVILRKLKEAAEQYLHDQVTGVVLTVPAYFNDSQRKATKDAGEIAGLDVLRIINEPTAAALSFSLDLSRKARIVVYDFGGGTIDISVLEVKDDVIRVLATAGDTNLGGNDLDFIFSDYLREQIKKLYNIDLIYNKLAMQRIRDAAENCKKELSGMEEHEINLPFIADTRNGPIHFSKYIKRSEFEELIHGEVDKTIGICRASLKRANLTKNDIDEVLLVGGSTRIPYVQKKVKEYFDKAPNKKVNPDEIVAMGAAIQGAIVKGVSKDVLLLDVTPLSLGVKTFGGAFTRVIDANTTIPTNRSLVFSTVEDNQEEVEIRVYQGESEAAEENKFLGKFALTGIKPASRGVPRIEVTFSYNINGILKVSAVDLSTKNKNEVIVSQSGLLSRNSIGKLKDDAEKFKESDVERRKLIKRKNDILRAAYSLKKHLGSAAADQNTVMTCKALIEKAEITVEKENTEKMDRILAELTEMNEGLELIPRASKEMQPKPEVIRRSGLVDEARFGIKDPGLSDKREAEPVKREEIEDLKIASIPEEDEIVEKKPGSIIPAEKIAEEKPKKIPEEEKAADKKPASNIKKEISTDEDLEGRSSDYIRSIERHLQTLELEQEIVNDCTYTIKKAKRVIDDGDHDALGRVYRDLKEMDYNLALISTYSVDEGVKNGVPEFDTQKLRKGMPTFETQKVPIGLVSLEDKSKGAPKKETGFDLDMYEGINFKKEDTRPIKRPKKGSDTQPIDIEKG